MIGSIEQSLGTTRSVMRRCLEYRLQRKDLSIEPFRLKAVLQTPLIDRSGILLNLAECQTFFLNAIAK